jgi:hypothetical protein
VVILEAIEKLEDDEELLVIQSEVARLIASRSAAAALELAIENDVPMEEGGDESVDSSGNISSNSSDSSDSNSDGSSDSSSSSSSSGSSSSGRSSSDSGSASGDDEVLAHAPPGQPYPAGIPGHNTQLHAAPAFETPHCPPLQLTDVAEMSTAACECAHFSLPLCGAAAAGMFRDIIDEGLQDDSRSDGAGGFNDETRHPNNEYRKQAYRSIALALGIYGQRIELPACGVEQVRNIWPAANGKYMGYHVA